MQRDMDLIRNLVLLIEAFDIPPGVSIAVLTSDPNLQYKGHNEDDVAGHLLLLIQRGLVDGARDMSGEFQIRGLTWEGYDFADTVRDTGVWSRTKEAVSGLGGFSLKLIGSVAGTIIRKEVERRIGPLSGL